ncbi:hypothetical protein L5876_12045 [Hyphobacterium sp. SN044]|uniref:hypothetical protein n=1 Tax=Hyphobacterium sp. SN044 TaxID=2912575 RepID=UPI001F4861A3|nr:hypothetical protein [Hyphobacterium sp. SN044]MCF8880548.1 hypothetical protein [Hyphobacterium sp. SN044]
MARDINDLIAHIRALEEELETELIARRRELGYRFTEGRARFTEAVKERQRAMKISVGRFLAQSGFLEILTSPFIYAVLVPIALLDAVASLFQAICFRVYGLRQVKRRDYLVFDRHRLAYLNWMQKLNCLYCSYANGVLAYVQEIASRTEQYWCPIKHAERIKGTHKRYPAFLEYGDTENYPDSLRKQRTRLRDEEEASETPPQ